MYILHITLFSINNIEDGVLRVIVILKKKKIFYNNNLITY